MFEIIWLRPLNKWSFALVFGIGETFLALNIWMFDFWHYSLPYYWLKLTENNTFKDWLLWKSVSLSQVKYIMSKAECEGMCDLWLTIGFVTSLEISTLDVGLHNQMCKSPVTLNLVLSYNLGIIIGFVMSELTLQLDFWHHLWTHG